MDITLKEKENRQNEFSKYINQLRQRNKSEVKNETTNINRLYNSRQNVIQMLNDYIKTVFKAQQKAEQPKEQPNTTDMSESNESAAPKKSETVKGRKIHRIKLSLYSLLPWQKCKPKTTHRNSKMKSEDC